MWGDGASTPPTRSCTCQRQWLCAATLHQAACMHARGLTILPHAMGASVSTAPSRGPPLRWTWHGFTHGQSLVRESPQLCTWHWLPLTRRLRCFTLDCYPVLLSSGSTAVIRHLAGGHSPEFALVMRGHEPVHC